MGYSHHAIQVTHAALMVSIAREEVADGREVKVLGLPAPMGPWGEPKRGAHMWPFGLTLEEE